jgi:hypothetical protein
MRVLIPQICVASRLLEIFQKIQLRGRRNGHQHRVVGSHRKGKTKKLQQATQVAAAAAAEQQQRRRHARPRVRCNDESQRAELGLGFR